MCGRRRDHKPAEDASLGQEVVAEDTEVARNESEEGRRPRATKDVIRASGKEREEHEATHAPFRPWCKHCAWKSSQ